MPFKHINNLTHYYVGNSYSTWCPSHHMLTNTHKNKKGLILLQKQQYTELMEN